MSNPKTSYSGAILSAFQFLLSEFEDVFVLGQGVWSPWYVGDTMANLEKDFGKDRVMDTPVSELGSTGLAVGASLCGYRPIVIHPRMDFMILAADTIVNQAAKWRHMLGGKRSPGLTIRSIVNRGGEQGAQHSQSLHSWFAHIPGLRVVMPYSVADARDLLIASVLSDDPVLYIDDRWLYEQEAELEPINIDKAFSLEAIEPNVVREGSDYTLVGSGYSVALCVSAAEILASQHGISAEVMDLRMLNPLVPNRIIDSVSKTGRLLAVDGGWKTCGMAGEIISLVSESIDPSGLKCKPGRVTLPDCPAPTSKTLEGEYYPKCEQLVEHVLMNCQ